MASVIRGDDNFDSSSTGPSTTYGDVGTYVGGYVTNVGFVDNNTNKAGSDIKIYGGASTEGHSLNGNQHSIALVSAGLSGTWRCVSSYEQSSSTYHWGSIWFRIS